MNVPIVVTELRESAYPLVLDSWTRGHWDGCAEVRRVLTRAEHRGVLAHRFDAVMSNANRVALAACSPDDTEWCAGWLLGACTSSELHVHWVYVRQPYRRQGICRALLDHAQQRAAFFGFSHKVAATHVSDRFRDELMRRGISLTSLGAATSDSLVRGPCDVVE